LGGGPGEGGISGQKEGGKEGHETKGGKAQRPHAMESRRTVLLNAPGTLFALHRVLSEGA